MHSMEHLVGTRLPSLRLPSTGGGEIDLPRLTEDRVVVYLYPGDDAPSRAPQPTSCAVQRASFREYALDFAAHGTKITGLSSERHQDQLAAASTERLPFPLLSDHECELAEALELPTFLDFGVRRYRRLTLICERGRIAAILYPVPPRRSAIQALSWLQVGEQQA
jgi:peroxiredoxin